MADPFGLQEGPRSFLKNPFAPERWIANGISNTINDWFSGDRIAELGWRIGDHGNSVKDRVWAGAELTTRTVLQVAGGKIAGKVLSKGGKIAAKYGGKTFKKVCEAAKNGVKRLKNKLKRTPTAQVATKGGNLVKIGAIEDDVMMFSASVGNETVEGISNFAIKDGKLFLDGLHLQGSSAGNVGRQTLWNLAKDLGKQFNVKEVIIQGGRRTTGRYKGQVPSPITIKVD